MNIGIGKVTEQKSLANYKIRKYDQGYHCNNVPISIHPPPQSSTASEKPKVISTFTAWCTYCLLLLSTQLVASLVRHNGLTLTTNVPGA